MSNISIIKTAIITFSLLVTEVSFSNENDVDEFPQIAITAGKISYFESDIKTNVYAIEYRKKPITKWKLIPAFGYMWSSSDSKYLYADVKYDWHFYKQLIFTPSLGTGIFDNNSTLDLGHPIEFRTGFELSYRFKKGNRLAVTAYHISNSKIAVDNPGTEIFVINFIVPLHQ